MTRNTSLDRRLAGLLCAVVSLCLLCPAAGLANTTNSIPYTNSFESYTNGFLLAGTDGWYGDSPTALTVVTNTYTYVGGDLPLTNATHDKTLLLDGIATNVITNSVSQQNIYIDMMVHATRWTEDDPPSLTNSMKTSIYFNSNGYLVAYGAYGWTAQGAPEEGTNWLTSSSFQTSTDQWVRITVDMRLSVPGGEEWFRVRLDGTLVEFDDGAYDVQSTTKPGPWLQVVNPGSQKMSSLELSGAGEFDDMQVITNNPILGTKYSVLVKLFPPGSAEYQVEGNPYWFRNDSSFSFYSGDSLSTFAQTIPQDTGCVMFTNAILINQASGATNDVWNSGDPDWDDATYQSETITGDTNYVYELHSQYQYKSLTIATNSGSLPQTASPAVGTYSSTYRYNDSILCTSADNSPLNTSTTRHFCTWTRIGSSPGSGEGTNTTFTLQANSTVTWNWRLQNWLATVKDGEPGFMQSDGNLDVGSSWWDAASNATITATGAGGWTNDHWYGTTNGCTYPAANKITAPMNAPRTGLGCYFVYVTNGGTWTLSIASAYGTPTPAVGTNTYADGSNFTCTLAGSPAAVNANTQAFCTGWVGTGHAPASGSTTNTGLFKLTENSGITWTWDTQYRLDTEVSGGNGYVNVSDGWYSTGTVVNIEATGLYGGTFVRWEGNTNGCSITDNAITAPMSEARTITAVFTGGDTQGPKGTPVSWLIANGITGYSTAEDAELGDEDSDTKLNWEEYVTGTDPSDPESVFEVLTVTSQSASNQVVWYATTNSGITIPFSMKRSTNLVIGSWSLVASNSISRAAADPSGTGTNRWWDTSVPSNAPSFYHPLVLWTNGP